MTNSRRILCVDDHADTCALIATILGQYEVIAALGVVRKTDVADLLPGAVNEIFALIDQKASPDDELCISTVN